MYEFKIMAFQWRVTAGLLFYMVSSTFGTSSGINIPHPKDQYTQHRLSSQPPLNGVDLSDSLSQSHDFVGSPAPQAQVWVSSASLNDILDTSTDLPPWNVSVPESAQEA